MYKNKNFYIFYMEVFIFLMKYKIKYKIKWTN